MAVLKARTLDMNEVREILSLEKKEITLETLRGLFGCKIGQENPRFNTYDKMRLPAGRLYNSETIETTVGRYLTNLIVLPEKYLKKYGFYNDVWTKGNIGKIESQLNEMLMADEISTKEYSEYIDRGEWLGMGTECFMIPTMNYDINLPIREVIEERDELFDKYSEGVKRGDPAVAEIIEKQVLAKAKKIIKDKGNECFDYFDSGVASFENNYKKTSVMCGALENPYTKKLDILKSNYIDGLDIKEYPKFCNLSIIGGYSRRS